MDFPILKYLDLLIGLAVVMLLVSTVVTAIAQVYLDSSFARARHLRDGLQELIAQVDPILLAGHKRYLAQRVQRHPLVSRGNTPVGVVTGLARNWLRRYFKNVPGLPSVNPGNVVQREELVGILLEWAGGEGPLVLQDLQLAKQSPADRAMVNRVRSDLRKALANAGISDPGAVVRKARQLALDQEAANPQLPSAQWRAQGLLQSASSPFTAKIFVWFDNTVARTSDNFALEARLLTCVVAFGVCWAIQLDSFDLIQRLARDDTYRAAMVANASKALERYDTLLKQAKPANDEAEAKAGLAGLGLAKEEWTKATKELRDPKLAIIPEKFAWEKPDPWSTISGGVIFSWVLVSLGAPFWYDLLKRLLSLRSVLARKDDEERKERQGSQQAANPAPVTPVTQPTVISDQPDLVEIKTLTFLRSGSPSGNAPSAGEAAADTLVSVSGAVAGESIPDAQNRQNNKWYRTLDGFFLWAGATDKP